MVLPESNKGSGCVCIVCVCVWAAGGEGAGGEVCVGGEAGGNLLYMA